MSDETLPLEISASLGELWAITQSWPNVREAATHVWNNRPREALRGVNFRIATPEMQSAFLLGVSEGAARRDPELKGRVERSKILWG